MLLCVIVHPPSFQLHLQDAGEGNGGGRGVPLRQQQVHSQAQPHKLCNVQVHLLQDTLSQTPTRMYVMCEYTPNHNEIIVLLCLILHLPSLQLHLHDAGEGSVGRLGVPPRQQQVYSQAQPHKLCDVQVH